ncbi:MAG: hypothetical protein ACR2GU_03340 [Rubrobacteraceae bacterium]
MAEKKKSRWEKVCGAPHYSGRQEKVMEYIIHRHASGASLSDIVQEEYVRRNATPAEVEEICRHPKLVQSAREQMGKSFSSGELDPKQRPE